MIYSKYSDGDKEIVIRKWSKHLDRFYSYQAKQLARPHMSVFTLARNVANAVRRALTP